MLECESKILDDKILKHNDFLMKIFLLTFFLSLDLYAVEKSARKSVNCLMDCDNHNPSFYREWQYEKSLLNSTKPTRPNVINCFNPAVLCVLPCENNSETTAVWKQDKNDNSVQLIITKINDENKVCFIKAVLPVKPPSGPSIMPLSPLLIGTGTININLGSNTIFLFYKATSGE